jgi:hypothetical protein
MCLFELSLLMLEFLYLFNKLPSLSFLGQNGFVDVTFAIIVMNENLFIIFGSRKSSKSVKNGIRTKKVLEVTKGW